MHTRKIKNGFQTGNRFLTCFLLSDFVDTHTLDAFVRTPSAEAHRVYSYVSPLRSPPSLKLRWAEAEREGFEPPDLLQSTVFKTAAFDRSAISPGAKLGFGASHQNFFFGFFPFSV